MPAEISTTVDLEESTIFYWKFIPEFLGLDDIARNVPIICFIDKYSLYLLSSVRRASNTLYSLQKGKSQSGCPGMIMNCLCLRGSSFRIWRVKKTLWLPLLSGPLWPGVVVPVRVSIMGQTDVSYLYLIGILDNM